MDDHLKGIQIEQGVFEQVNRIRAMCRDIYDYTNETNSNYLFQNRSDKVSLNLTWFLFSVE